MRIEYSVDKIGDYKKHCRGLSAKLKEIKITNRTFIQEIIDRYKNLINESNRTIERNQDNTIKIMQILIIPFSLEVLKVIINRQSNVLEMIEIGLTSLMAVAIIWLIVACSIYMYSSLTIKKRLNDYKLIVNDLQGIIDLEKFDSDDEKGELVANRK